MIGVGDPIPDVQVWRSTSETVGLRQLAGKSPYLLLSYLFDWSSTCTNELSQLNSRRDELLATGVTPYGISRDSPWSHVAWQQALDIEVPLLSDWTGEAVRSLDDRPGVPRPARRRPQSRLRGGRRGHHPRRMAIRRLRDLGLRHARRVRTLALVALYGAAALVATLPASLDLGSAFIAEGADGDGEAAAGDHLQAVYRFWLVGHRLARGEAPWVDPYSFQPLVEPQVVLAGWPFGLAFWPLDAAFGPVVAWNLLLLGTIFAAGLLTYGWLRELELPAGAAAVGGLAFAIAPYRLAQSGTHLLGWIAVLLPLALLAYERSRRAGRGRDAHLWGALAALAIASIPLSGQLHLALGAIPFLAVYVAVRAAPVAASWAGGGLAAAVGIGLAVHLGIVRDSAESEGRSLQEVGEYSAGFSDLLSRWHAVGGRAVRLPRLAPPRARRRGFRRPLGVAATGARRRPRGGRAPAGRYSRSGRRFRSTSGSGTSSRRSASRACPAG